MSVTIRDVAKRAGTSSAAVSAVLRDSKNSTIRVGAETRGRILRAAEELGYTGNAVARALATGRTGIIGVLVPYYATLVEHNPFKAQVMSGVIEEATNLGQQLLLLTAAGDHWEDSEPAALTDSRVDGLIAVSPRRNSPLVQHCRNAGHRCVAISYAPEGENLLTVNGDNFRGSSLAVEHLVSLGHRKIAFLSGDMNTAHAVERREGFLQAMAARGLECGEPGVVEGGTTVKSGEAAAKRLLELPAGDRPTAVFASNDVCADGALRAFKAAGLRVPEDIAVVGFDDTMYARLTDPPLTSINMPLYSMGRLAVRLMAADIQGLPIANRQPTLRVHLRVRSSCGANPADHPFPLHPAIEDFEG